MGQLIFNTFVVHMKYFKQSCLKLKIELNIPQCTHDISPSKWGTAFSTVYCTNIMHGSQVREDGVGVGKRWTALSLILFDSRIGLQGTNRTITITLSVMRRWKNRNLKKGKSTGM